MARDRLIAVDVGTGSARAGVFEADGRLLSRADHPIAMHRPAENHAEHDSEDIWRAVCAAVRGAMGAAGCDASEIAGLAFDATCSLVVRDRAGLPLSVSTGGEARWDTIVWLDHRALDEADECTATGDRILDFIGGVMSPEMQTPKLMWLKRHLPATWREAGYFFDLADFLTFKASGSTARSQCTLTCKWAYLGHEQDGWQQGFLERVGIGDMVERGRLARMASPVGGDLGPLTREAADALGLDTGCRVGVSLIDAHAGTLGVLGGYSGMRGAMERHMALIAGTSSCLMAISARPVQAGGIWGPSFGAVFPGAWLSEGGQSATGALLDHILCFHGAGGEPTGRLHDRVVARIAELRAAEGAGFARRLHVLPDFHGNRSPLADPHAVGVISGLTLDASFDGLCRLYYKTAVAIALGIRHILERLNESGYRIDTLHVTGGHTKNRLMMDLYADATGCRVATSHAPDAMLLGTAMAAATAAGFYPGLAEAAAAMDQGAHVNHPDPGYAEDFEREYRVFLEMHAQRVHLDEL